MIFGDTSATYLLKQTAKLSEFRGEGVPPNEETQRNHGLVLVAGEPPALEWKRTIDEYILDEASLAQLKKQRIVRRSSLYDRHLRQTEKRRLRLGPAARIQVKSDPLNVSPRIDTDEADLRLDSRWAYLPTVLPRFRAPERKAGEPYTGEFPTTIRDFTAALPYTVVSSQPTPASRVLELAWKPEPASAGNDQLQIVIAVTGKTRYEFGALQRLPDSITGQMTLSVRGVFVSSRAQPADAELERMELQWTCERILLPFDADNVYPESWAESEKAPGMESPATAAPPR